MLSRAPALVWAQVTTWFATGAFNRTQGYTDGHTCANRRHRSLGCGACRAAYVHTATAQHPISLPVLLASQSPGSPQGAVCSVTQTMSRNKPLVLSVSVCAADLSGESALPRCCLESSQGLTSLLGSL
jgi:hypothetical protein